MLTQQQLEDYNDMEGTRYKTVDELLRGESPQSVKAFLNPVEVQASDANTVFGVDNSPIRINYALLTAKGKRAVKRALARRTPTKSSN